MFQQIIFTILLCTILLCCTNHKEKNETDSSLDNKKIFHGIPEDPSQLYSMCRIKPMDTMAIFELSDSIIPFALVCDTVYIYQSQLVNTRQYVSENFNVVTVYSGSNIDSDSISSIDTIYPTIINGYDQKNNESYLIAADSLNQLLILPYPFGREKTERRLDSIRCHDLVVKLREKYQDNSIHFDSNFFQNYEPSNVYYKVSYSLPLKWIKNE